MVCCSLILNMHQIFWWYFILYCTCNCQDIYIYFLVWTMGSFILDVCIIYSLIQYTCNFVLILSHIIIMMQMFAMSGWSLCYFYHDYVIYCYTLWWNVPNITCYINWVLNITHLGLTQESYMIDIWYPHLERRH